MLSLLCSHWFHSVHEKIRYGFRMNFNYNILLLVASILAGLGLVANSNATVIASMLVSPIMGPVIGLAYGATIRDWSMVKRALFAELVSLVVCMFIGALIGLLTGPTGLSDNWPTPEMDSRGDIVNLYVAFPVAFFSGLGVAVSLLDDNQSSLVGVAISASLLPPAVNTGIIWVAGIFTREEINDHEGISDYASPPNFHEYRQMGRTSIGKCLATWLMHEKFKDSPILHFKNCRYNCSEYCADLDFQYDHVSNERGTSCGEEGKISNSLVSFQ